MVLTVRSPPLSRRFGVKTRLLDAVFRNLDAIAELDVAGCGHAARQTIDVDEAVGGLLVEAVAGIVGGQVVVVQRAVGATAGDDGATAVQNLLAGKVDCVVIDKAPAQEYVKANAGLTILDTEYANEDYAIGMAKDNTALQEALNKALAELKADGTIQSIIDKYISAK